MSDDRTAPRWLAPAVFLGALLLFAAALPGRGLWHNDEHRYAEVARVMTTPGGDALVPHLNGAIYPDKPPLMFWLVAMLHAAGVDLAIAARIPSVVAGAGAVLAAFCIAKRLYGRTAGIATAVVLATTSEFWWLSVRGNLDALMTCFATLGMAAFVRALFPAADERPRRGLFLTLGFLTIGVGTIAKGPHSVAFPAISLVAFLLVVREFRTLRSFAWGVPLAFLPVVLFFVAAGFHAGWAYVDEMTIGQWVRHPSGGVDKVEPFWFYAKALPIAALPWTLLLPAAIFALVKWRRPEERRADVLVVCWIAVQLVLLSISKAKRDLYLTSVMPPVALLVGRLVRDVVADPAGRIRQSLAALGRWTIGGIFVLGGGAIALVALLCLIGRGESVLKGWGTWLLLSVAGALVAALLAAALVTLGLRAMAARDPSRVAACLGGAAVAAMLVAGCVVLPALDRGKSSRAFYESIAAEVGDAPLADYGGADFAPNWVLSRDVVPRLQDVEDRIERRRRAEAFVRAAGDGPAFLVVDRGFLERNGMPAGMEVGRTWPRPMDDDLLLLRRAGR